MPARGASRKRLDGGAGTRPPSHSVSPSTTSAASTPRWGPTPAVAADIAERPWTIAELTEAALAEVPVEAPVPVPLTMATERAGHAIAARPLPNGGWLRLVGAAAPPAKGAPLVTPPPVGPTTPPAIALVPVGASTDGTGQLDLLAWRPRPVAPVEAPKPRPMGQLNLFGLDLEPEPK